MGKPVTSKVHCLDTLGMDPISKVELCARICYNSEASIKPGGAEAFLKGQILSKGHESVIEHEGAVFLVEKVTMDGFGWLLSDWPNAPLFQISVLRDSKGTDGDLRKDLIISGNFRAFRDFYRNKHTSPGIQSCMADRFLNELVTRFPILGYGIEGCSEQPAVEGLVFLGIQSGWAVEPDFEMGKASASTALQMKHGTLSFRIDGVSRALTHQLVRHRPVAYSQRSQRYCGESDFDFVVPEEILRRDQPGVPPVSGIFEAYMEKAADGYRLFQKTGIKNEDARFLLPNACETNLVVTATLNQWLHMCKLRTSPKAQWEIRGVFKTIAEQIAEITGLPVFKELQFEEAE